MWYCMASCYKSFKPRICVRFGQVNMSADEPKLPKSRDKRRVPTSERNVGWTSQQTSADSQNHVTDEEHGISMSEEDSNNQRYWTLEKTEKKRKKRGGQSGIDSPETQTIIIMEAIMCILPCGPLAPLSPWRPKDPGLPIKEI
jgi:hypothetical protein